MADCHFLFAVPLSIVTSSLLPSLFLSFSDHTLSTYNTTIRFLIFFSSIIIMSTNASLVARSAAAFANTLTVQRLSDKAKLPVRGSEFAAGLDLSSAVDLVVKAGERAIVATDLRIACPAGTYARIAPRSGLAAKYGIDVGAGVVDADYRGPVGVILFNFGTDDFEIKQGDRIAQLILERICMPDIVEIGMDETLPATERGAAGFGSTGGFVDKNATTTIGGGAAEAEVGAPDDKTSATKKQRTISPTGSAAEEETDDAGEAASAEKA
jgi:dUTP pyrophosphatase